MARMPRVIGVGLPHHITQRGNRRLPTFFQSTDYQAYLDLLKKWCHSFGTVIWAYCLMPNHVHLIAVPSTETALARSIGETHRRYSRRINFREGWRGFLWQGRFSSCLLDQNHLVAAVRYVERNPVRAALARSPLDWPWSSARFHSGEQDDGLVEWGPLKDIIHGDWERFLRQDDPPIPHEAIRLHTRTGRPLGDDRFLGEIERRVGHSIRPGKPGPKRQHPSIEPQAGLPGM
ncbi:MAG: transposase [Candidatus Riflebacteria bacterium]|nr:transposase [Candidatus Riflebacteria bacterium]